MFYFMGNSEYGKTDHLPGLMYVKTRFFSVWWLPLIPLYSMLYRDDDSGEPVLEIGFHFKSILSAWIRTIAGFVIVILTYRIVRFQFGLHPEAGDVLSPVDYLGILGMIMLMAAVYYATYAWSQPRFRRACIYADDLGLDQKVLKIHYPERFMKGSDS
ncbi:hypothetical protein GC170_07560 [bacterium]|nr:hypothetical protein [bacterium]